MAVSYAAQTLGVVMLVKLAMFAPAVIKPLQQKYQAIELAPSTPAEPKPSVATKVTAPPPMALPKVMLPQRVQMARIETPAPVLPPKSLPIPVTTAPVAPTPAPKVIATGTFDAQPAPAVHGNPTRKVESAGFSGSSATPTTNAPARAVQTGGFGDPNGVAGTSNKPGLHAAALGAFDLPAGGGAGNGTGGTRGIRGVVASTGFGDGIAGSGSGDRGGHPARGGGVSEAGFNSTEQARSTPQRREAPVEQATPVQIVSKPAPIYTEEARRLKIEGEVVLRIVFGGDGSIREVAVVRGLGHGLDEAAIAAAKKIQFQPAHRGSQTVDYTALVHVTFQLA